MDHRGAGVAARLFQNVSRPHTFAIELPDQRAAAAIVADRRDENDAAAQPCGGDRLVRAFPARTFQEHLAGRRFALPRQPARPRHEIGTGRADDDEIDDGCSHAHFVDHFCVPGGCTMHTGGGQGSKTQRLKGPEAKQF